MQPAQRGGPSALTTTGRGLPRPVVTWLLGPRLAVAALVVSAVVASTVVAATVVATTVVATTVVATTGPGPARPHPGPSPVRIFPAIRVQTASGPAGGLTPRQVRAAYDTGPLLTRSVTGKGQTIVIVDSFGSPTIAADLAHFDRHYGLAAPPSFRIIQPAGRVPEYHATDSRTSWAAETTLDVEWAHVLAPGARILLVETPTAENEGTTGFPQIVTAEKYVLRHRLGQVISQSFAATEQTFPSRAALARLRGAYQLAASDHVPVLAASGDEGATGFKFEMTDLYTHRAVSWPATDPLVTAVGGTRLFLRANGSRRQPDVAWADSGGGRSLFFARPAFQNGVRAVTGSQRGVPDVSMDASCASPVSVYGSYGGNDGPWSTICGTSVATPMLAGLVALASQVAGHRLGEINQALYAMAAAHDRGIVDIRAGNNTQTFFQDGQQFTVPGFGARAGYDLVSGVGSVNAAYFVPELAHLAG
jgi:subtilase family serine protease